VSHVDGRLRGEGGVELYWQGRLPDGEPTGVLLLCHGLGEHSGRYGNVVEALLPDGWAVYGLDHRGHGRSRGRRAHVRRYGDWLADYDAFRRLVAARHPGLPVFLLGHSMGGQIALAYALDHQDDLRGLVLSAPPLVAPALPRAVVSAVTLLTRAAPTLRRGFVDLDKISKDAAVLTAYRSDALVHQGHPTLGLTLALAAQMPLLLARAPELRLPVLIMHGTADAVCAPEGSRLLEAACGSPDTTVRWYDDLWHEIFNEPERDRPLADLREWLDARR
jgi:acylglycerol lipase